MIARVIPLLRLPRQLGVFDYVIPAELAVVAGALVTVEFRRRHVVGLVAAIAPTSDIPPARLKPLLRVLTDQPIVPTHFFEIISYVCREGVASPATALRSILPSFRQRDHLDLNGRPDRPTRRRPGNPPQLLTYRYEAARLKKLGQLVDETRAAGRSLLIIVPLQDDAARLAREVPGATMFDRNQTTTAFRKKYIDVLESKGSVVIGTRSAIFAPLRDLGAVVVVDEESDELVQDEPNPRYDVRAVAMLLARHTGAALYFMSRLPSLVTWKTIKESAAIEPLPVPVSSFTDLEEARRGGDYELITERNRDAIGQAVRAKQRVVIVHGRAAQFGSLECRDCGYVATCPVCTVPFRIDANQLVCRHCGTNAPIPTQCPACRSVRLRGRGQGLPLLADTLKRDPAVRLTLDPADRRANVVLITPTETRSTPDDSFDLGLITRYDSVLAVPRYDADERARRIICHLAAKIRRGGRLIVQASPIFQDIVAETFRGDWRQRSLSAAERYGYPPAWRIMQLRRRSSADDRTQSPESVAAALRRTDPDLNITGPLPARARSRTNRPGHQIILRYRQQLTPSVRTILESLDEHWTVTLDPRELQ